MHTRGFATSEEEGEFGLEHRERLGVGRRVGGRPLPGTRI
jgi:hypothetical protein